MAASRHEKRLFNSLKSTCRRWRLLEEGDHVLVAVSGGKDSYTMLELLHAFARSLPFEVKLTAVHLDQQQPGYDGSPLIQWLQASGYRYEILSEDTYSVVLEHTREGGTYCAVCSRLRRGILYTAASRLGCNKIALGHHRDDGLETFLMNLFYAGRLQAMPAVYTTDDGRFQVIRPLIDCDEDTIREYAQQQAYPILPCNLCGSQENLKREAMRRLLDDLGKSNGHIRSIMANALSNVRPSHLLDPEVLQAWSERDPAIRPAAAKVTRLHAAALPVLQSEALHSEE